VIDRTVKHCSTGGGGMGKVDWHAVLTVVNEIIDDALDLFKSKQTSD
jgi:hypothetical protein